jgi:uncharacterized protein YndB with AHSA1/START domain
VTSPRARLAFWAQPVDLGLPPRFSGWIRVDDVALKALDKQGGVPMQFVNNVTIQRPPSEVFAYLAHFENIPRWNYAITETRQTSDGPVGVGTTFKQRRMLPRPSEETFKVTEFVPDTRVAITGDLGPFEGTLTYQLDAVPGGTRLTNEADLAGKGFLGIAAPLATSRIREAVDANLGELRSILESRKY